MPRTPHIPSGQKVSETFDATLKFVSFSSHTGGSRTMNYVDIESGLLYRISNFQIENLVKRGQLRPVITATWGWTTQGGWDVIKPITITYVGESIPAN